MDATCHACGYDRAGIPAMLRCPECGELPESPLPPPPRELADIRFLLIVLVILAVGACVVWGVREYERGVQTHDAEMRRLLGL